MRCSSSRHGPCGHLSKPIGSGAAVGAPHVAAGPGNTAALLRSSHFGRARPAPVNALQATRTPSPERRYNPDALSSSPLLPQAHASAAAGTGSPAMQHQLGSPPSPHPQPGPHLLTPGLSRPARPSFLDADLPPAPSSQLLNQSIKATTTWQGLAALVHQQGHHFNFIHVSAAVTHLAQMLDDPHAARATSASAAAASSPWPQPQPALRGGPSIHTSHTAAGGSTLPDQPASSASIPPQQQQQSQQRIRAAAPPSAADPHGDFPALMDTLLTMVHCRMHQFGARQAANTLWALSVLHPTHPGCLPLMSRLLGFTRALLPWCEPQHLSNVALAAARAELYLEDEWVETFLTCVETTLGRFQPQHLANTAWALAALGIAPDAAWVAVFLSRTQAVLPYLAPVDVSQVLYSLACLGVRPQGAVQAATIASLYQRLLQQGGTGAAGVTAAAAPAAAAGVAAATGRQLGLLVGSAASTQSIANSLWGLATMGVSPSRAWLQEVFAEVEERMHEFQPQELSNLLWAMATLTAVPPASLLQRLYDASEPLLPSFTAQALSNTIWAIATLQADAGQLPASSSALSSTPAPPKPWAAAFLESFEAALPSMRDQHVSNTMWALARLGVVPRPELAAAAVQHLYRLDRAAADATGGESATAGVGGGGGGEGVSGQALANSLGALAGLGFQLDGPAGQLVAEMVRNRLASEPGGGAAVPPSPLSMTGAKAGGAPVLVAAAAASAAAAATTAAAAAAAALVAPSKRGRHKATTAVTASPDAAAAAGAGVPLSPTSSPAVKVALSASSAATATAAAAAAPDPAVMHGSSDGAYTSGSGRIKGKELAQLTFALGKLGVRLPDDTAATLLTALHRRLPTVAAAAAAASTPATSPPVTAAAVQPELLSAPEDLSQVLWGLASLGLNPERTWLASFWSSCCLVLPRMDAADLGQLVYAMAKLGCNPQGLGLAPQGSGQVPQGLGQAPQGSDLGAVAHRVQATGTKASAKESSLAAPSPAASAKAAEATTASAQVSAVLATAGSAVATEAASESAAAAAGAGTASAAAATVAVPGAASPLRRPLFTPPAAASSPAPASPSPASAAASPSSSPSSPSSASSAPPSSSPTAPVPTGPGIGLLLFRVAATLPSVPSYGFANLAWGLAQMGVTPGTAWCEVVLAEQLRRRCGTMEPSHLATAVWALAKLGARPAPKSLVLVESAIYKRLRSLRPRELAACAWAFSTMRYTPNVEWLDAFAQQCMSLVSEFSMQDWVVMVRSLSTIAEQEHDAVIYLEDLFISPQLEAQVHKFPPSALVPFIHSCGVLGARSGRLLGRLLAAARPHMAQGAFRGQELVAMICTLAKLQYRPEPAFITAWLSAFAARIPECHGPALAAAAWALATLGVKPHERWQALFVNVLSERTHQLAPKHVSMLVWALGELGTTLDAPLVRKVSKLLGRMQMGFGGPTARRGARWAMAKIRSRSRVVEARRRALQARRLARKQRALAYAQARAAQQQGAVQLGVPGVQGALPAGDVEKVGRGSKMQRKQQLQPQVQGEEERIPAVAGAAAGK